MRAFLRALRVASASSSAALVALLACSGAHAAAPLPPLPGANAPASASGAPANAGGSNAASAASSPATLPPPTAGESHAMRGVVQVLRGGRSVALGAVLGQDGRVITALSALGGSDTADIRYADGTTAHAKLGHLDPEWDLALLVPQNGPKWTDGLAASEADPGAADLRAFAPAAFSAHSKATTAETAAPFQGRSDVHAKDGTVVHDALTLETKSATVGSPVIDANGAVVALLVHACKDAQAGKELKIINGKLEITNAKTAAHPACMTTTVGAPVAALRNFLVRTPSTAVAPSPWLGIVGEIERAGAVMGVRVLAVAPQSPADKSGLKPSSDAAKADVVTAVDGVPVDSPERLSEEIGKHAIGQKIPLLVFKNGKLREVPVTLRAAP